MDYWKHSSEAPYTATYVHHVGELRSAAYCPRQAYYDRHDDAEDGVPDVYVAVAELAHHYDRFVEDTGEALVFAAELADIEPGELQEEVDVDAAVESLQRIRDGKPELWMTLTEPDKEQLYVETGRLRGTVDKAVSTQKGYVASSVKAGSPPREGVWPSQRVEAAAVQRLLDTRFEPADRVHVEFPRVGEVRTVEVDDEDHQRVDELLDILDELESGDPPKRTRQRGRCISCSYRERCGVDSPLVALKQLGGLPSSSESDGFGSRVTERFEGLFD